VDEKVEKSEKKKMSWLEIEEKVEQVSMSPN